MAPALKLITSPNNPNAFKALIAAKYANVKIDVPAFEWGKTNKSADFLKLNPIGKIPVLSTPSGPIFESNSIARYVARQGDGKLLGANSYEASLVDQWLDFAANELQGPSQTWAGPLYGHGTRDMQTEEKAKANVSRALGALNTYLSTHTYLVGETITLADIVVACGMFYGFWSVLSVKFMADYPHVQRYFFTVVNQPNFKAVLGEVKQRDETPTDVVPPEERPFPTGPKAPAAKVEAAPAPATPAASGEEGEEAPKPKAKNPLDLLPPSPMVMDTWKRLYSNTKAANFREVAINGFWEMYDAEGYSLWFCDYKFNEENTVKFVTLNKVSGFLQRMDLARKYAFAKMCILGPDAGPFVIKGVWLFRGPDVPKFVLEECYDCELYEWTKVDLSDAVQKERVNQYFEEPDEIDGLKLQEAKCFK